VKVIHDRLISSSVRKLISRCNYGMNSLIPVGKKL
jgi:hypothetical protein